MRRITNITIEKFKGIDSLSLDFNDLFSNKLNLLVAPNGFGKSSLAHSFDSLIRGKLKVPDKWQHDTSTGSDQKLSVSYQIDDLSNTVVADATKNEISNEFDIVVINSKLTSVTRHGFGNIKATSKIGHETITLIECVPKKMDFPYKISTYKSLLKGMKYNIINLRDTLLINRIFILWITHLDLKNQISKKTPIKILEQIKDEIKKGHDSYSSGQVVTLIGQVDFFKLFYDKIKSTNYHSNEDELIILWYQFVDTLFQSYNSVVDASRYFLFNLWKDNLSLTLKLLNSAKHESAELKMKKKTLSFDVVNFEKLSNGQRDVASFIAQLFKAEYALLHNSKRDNSILIIDEVFDYLDDANIVSCQYFVSKFIESFKSFGKNIFPIVLTHLAPSGFDSYKTHKMKNHFLQKRNSSITENDIRKIILAHSDFGVKRTDKELIAHYYVHFTDKVTNEIPAVGLSSNVTGNQSFYEILRSNLLSWKNGRNEFDPFAVCLGLRIEIERHIFNLIETPREKNEFLSTRKTAEKLNYAEKIGISVPEVFYLLGIIYNETAHTKEHQQQFVESKITSQLNNQIISTLMKEALNICLVQ